MTDVELKIKSRAYQSPGRARVAISRASLRPKEKNRLRDLVDLWENEGVVDHVVGGLPERNEPEEPEAHRATPREPPLELLGESETFELPIPNLDRISLMKRTALGINLNAVVRVRLTMLGLAQLHDARHRVSVPEDLVQRCGVWETTLWELMAAFGPKFSLGDEPFVNGVIEVLDTRMPL